MKRYAVVYVFSDDIERLILGHRADFLQRLRNAGAGVEACLLTGRPYCPLYEFQSEEGNETSLMEAVVEISVRMTESGALPPIKFLTPIRRRNKIGVEIDKHHQIPQAHRLALHECSGFARKWTIDELRAGLLHPAYHDGLQSYGDAFAQGLYSPYVPLAFVYDNIPNEEVRIPMNLLNGFTLGTRMHYGASIVLVALDEKGSIHEVLTSAPALAQTE